MLLGLLVLAGGGPLSPWLSAQPVPPRLLGEVEGRADFLSPTAPFAIGDLAYAVLIEVDEGEEPNLVDATEEWSLWRTDRTAPGTFHLLPEGVSMERFFGPPDTLGDVFFFVACEHGGQPPGLFGGGCPRSDVALWRTDGTLEGTFPLPLDEGSSLRMSPNGVAVAALGRFFFAVRDADDLSVLWSTDGTPEGTGPALVSAALGIHEPGPLEAFGGRLLFDAYTLPGAEEARQVVVRSDGTPNGTETFTGPFDGEGWTSLIPADDSLYVLARGPEISEPPFAAAAPRYTLWAGSGAEDLRQVLDLGFRDPSWNFQSSVAGGKIFVTLARGEFEPKLEVWGSDGTAAGSGLALELSGNPLGPFELYEEPASLPGGSAFLRMWDEEHGWEPWATDGTPGGTRRLADLCPGQCSSNPFGQGVIQGDYLFIAGDVEHGREMWRWDPETDEVSRLGEVCTGQCTSVRWLAGSRGDLVFVETQDEEDEPALWRVRADGSDPRLVTDLTGFRTRIFGTPFFGVFDVSTLQSGDDWIFWARDPERRLGLWSVPLPADPGPPPPPREPLGGDGLPGFDVWVEITSGAGSTIPGRAEADCIPETLCVSGAVHGRSEVFVRVVGPKPNGRLWPTLVKFSTSTVEVWIRQRATGLRRYYRLEGAAPGSSELPGLFVRDGFPQS